MQTRHPKPKPAKILLEPVSGTGKLPPVLPAGTQISLPPGTGEPLPPVLFETDRDQFLPGCRLTGLFRKESGSHSFQDISLILDHDIPVPVYPFGKEPKAGNAFYIIADSLPPSLSWTIFFAEAKETAGRQKPVKRDRQIFSRIRWEVFAKEGGADGEPQFIRIRNADFTGGFLSSGELKLRMPRQAPCIYSASPMPGFCIRATLEETHYDAPPQLTGFLGFVLEAIAKETKASCRCFHNEKGISVTDPLFSKNRPGHNGSNEAIYVREDRTPFYRKYLPLPEPGYIGRYYEILPGQGDDAPPSLCFKKESTGFGPRKQKNSIRFLSYSGNLRDSASLGKIYGFDNQKIRLPFSRILRNSFFVIVKKEHPDNGDLFLAARPDISEPGSFSYRLFEDEGFLVIDDPGDFIGGELFIGGLEVQTSIPPHSGIKKGSLLYTCSGTELRCACAPALDGAAPPEHPASRINGSNAGESAHIPDYAKLAKNTPGILGMDLCMSSTYIPEQNRVQLKAHFPEDMDQKTKKAYRNEILSYLESKRQVSTKIELEIH